MKLIFGLVFMGLILMGASFVVGHGDESSELYGDHHGMMSGFYGGMFGMGFFGWIFMALVIVVLVLFVVWLIKQLQEKPRMRKR